MYYMQEDSLAIMPVDGFCSRNKQSAKAFLWMELEEKKLNAGTIKTAANGGEAKVGK